MNRQRLKYMLLLIILLALMATTCSRNGGTDESVDSDGIAANAPPVQVGGPPALTQNIPSKSPGSHVANSSTGLTVNDLSNTIADVVDEVLPAVVFISAKIETRSFFFGRSVETATGSGVIIDPNGYILTNNHVVDDAIELEVTLPGTHEPFEAHIVGTDPLTDLAVIQINADDLPTVEFGDASALRPGNLVIAIGNPLGLEGGPTITLGVVSNTERSFSVGESRFYDVIQTDAAINPGNSGGPLIDLSGRIVGICSIIYNAAQNIGFAISANTAQPVYEALVGEEHRVIRPWLGVVFDTVTSELAANADLSRSSGVVITYVEKGSPADKAGLKARDVITVFDGKQVTEATQLIKELWNHEVGDTISITFWRDNEEKELQIKLTQERPE